MLAHDGCHIRLSPIGSFKNHLRIASGKVWRSVNHHCDINPNRNLTRIRCQVTGEI